MSINLKKILLTGTALVAISFSTQAYAANQDDNTDNGSTAALTAGNSASFTAPAAGVDEIFTVADGVAIGDTGVVVSATNADGVGKLQFNGSSVATGTIGGAANRLGLLTAGLTTKTVSISGNTFATTITIQDVADPAAGAAVTNFGAGVTATTFSLVATGATNASTQASTVTGNFTATTTAVTAGPHAGDTASLTLNGATNAVGAATLTDGAGGALATLTFGGGAAQTVSGTIDGSGAGKGKLVIANAGGTTFSGAVGNTQSLVNITVAGANADSAATFKATTKATAIVLGDGANANTNTLTFDGTTAGFTVTGTVNGTAGDTDNVVVSGGNTITTAGVWGGGTTLQDVKVTGATTVLSAGNSMTADTFTLASGGTLKTSGAATLTGLIDGAGTLDIGATTTTASNIGATTPLTKLNISAAVTHTASGNVSATTANFAADGVLSIASGKLLVANVTTDTTNTGTLTLVGGVSTVTGTVGATGKLLKVVNAGANGAVNSISGDVFATTTNVTGTGTLALAGNLTGALAFAAANGTVTLASGKSITGTVDAAGNNGTLTLSGGAQTVSGTVGATNALLVLNAGATGGTSTFSSDVKASTINVTGNGALALNGATTGALIFSEASTGTVTIADAKNFTGAMNGTAGGVVEGNVVFSGTTGAITTIGNAALLNSITLNGGTSVLQKTVTTTGNVLAANTTQLNGNIFASGGTFTVGAGQTLSSTIFSDTIYGRATAATTGGFSATGVLDLTVGTNAFIPNNTVFTIINAGAGAANDLGVGKLVVNDVASTTVAAVQAVTTGLITWTETVHADDLIITATRAAAAAVSTTGNSDSVGALLDTIAATGDATVDAAQGYVQQQTTAAGVTEALESLTPTIDGGAVTAALDVGAVSQGLADTRIASLRTGDNDMTGMAAGMSDNGVSMWLQGYGQYAQQDVRNAVDGYDAGTLGVAVGVDTTNIVGNGVVGIVFNYGNSNIDSDNANTTETDVDSYGVNLYGNVDLGDQAFGTAQIGYAYNDIESTRHNVGGPGINALGQYSSDQYSAKLGLGRDYPMDQGLTLTPSVSAGYVHLNTDGYTETGPGANLTVNSDGLNVLNIGADVKAAWKLQNADGSVMKPSVHVGYAYDAIGDRYQTLAGFVGAPAGGTFATSGADPARSTFNAGLGVTYMTTANWDVSANYDFAYKQDYDAHSGVLRATSHF